MAEIIYLGHSAFEITNGEKSFLVDPFLAANPDYDWKNRPITDILLTHAHADHIGSAVEISKTTGAKITAVFELAQYCAKKGARADGISFGGWLNFGWFRAIFLPAFHSSVTPEGVPAGMPASILFEVNGTKIYHAGDTCLSAEMKVVKEIYSPEVALLPIGGHFTMDAEHAAIAANWLGAATVIPMHYNTFEAIKANVEEFSKKLAAQNIDCKVLGVNESLHTTF